MRIDKYLCEKGYCASRTLASRLIEEGRITADGRRIKKPSAEVDDNAEIIIEESPLTRYVSRGGLKLEAALDAFKISVCGMTALDIGSSTGGFTDCLLKGGAKEVYAVDCGSNQLHESLRGDSRIVLLENTNARCLTENEIPEKADIAVMDVSFISQSLLYEAVAKFTRENAVFVSLIKPQFECGRALLGKGGIVKNQKAALEAVERLKSQASKHGLIMKKVIDSPILGGDGNKEYLALFVKE